MTEASENRWGQCPLCQEANSQRALCCCKCGARLPWAATGVASAVAGRATNENAPRNRSQAEMEAIMNGARETLKAKDEAWKPVGMRGETEEKQYQPKFDANGFFYHPRNMKIMGVALALLLAVPALRATVFKPRFAYRVAAPDLEQQKEDELNASRANDFVAVSSGSSDGSGPTSAPVSVAAAPAITSAPAVAQDVRTVTYRVQGTATRTQIRFQNGAGFDTRIATRLPWSISCSLRPGTTAAIVARLKSQGDITVAIDVEGQAVFQKSAQGENQVVACQGRV